MALGARVSELEIRPFLPGDESAVNAQFNEVFGTGRSLEEWLWKFPPRPEGRPVMLAFTDGELAGQYAAVTSRFQVDDRVWPAAQIVDVFSTPSGRRHFGRRGVIVHLVERFIAEFAENGRHPLCFGFPGRRALRLGVLQLGYDVIPPPDIVFLRRAGGGGFPELARFGYRAEAARDWEPRLNRLWERARRDYPVAAVRDAGRVLERLAGHPTARYHKFLVFPRLSTEPVAFAAFRIVGEVCFWVELLWDHDHPGALALLSVLGRRLAVRLGARREEMWLNGDGVGEELLARLGFVCESQPDGLVMVVRSFHPELDLERMRGRIYLTMADADLV